MIQCITRAVPLEGLVSGPTLTGNLSFHLTSLVQELHAPLPRANTLYWPHSQTRRPLRAASQALTCVFAALAVVAGT